MPKVSKQYALTAKGHARTRENDGYTLKTPSEAAIFWFMAVQHKNGRRSCTQTELHEEVPLSERTVGSAVRAMVANGVLERVA